MDTKQQTAVDWLFKQLWDMPKDKFDWYAALAQAKQMEKEQIMEAYDKVSMSTPEQYYTETYESTGDNKAL